MKFITGTNKITGLSMLMLLSVLFSTCKKDDDENKDVFENNYSGEFFTDFDNEVPPWSVRSNFMEVNVKKNGDVSIADGTLFYSGDTIIQDQSKIERYGEIEFSPVAWHEMINGKLHIVVDPAMTVTDHQKYYVKDSGGNWTIYNEMDNTVSINDELIFPLTDAVDTEATVESTDQFGSFKFTLKLDPLKK
ncbi:MAG: hypothetical protein RQ866_05380 [Bacteroidales bacterium]|nr:hypothetical protein [Bacteroidales bacterium]